MVFHSGVLLYLAEQGELENVKYLSTVSGGSLLAGLVYKEGDYKWPDSKTYKEKIYPSVRKIITTIDLQTGAILSLLKPVNWSSIASKRANVLAKTMESKWGIKKSLADLDKTVEWTINGTTTENSRRFRFKSDTCGDYELGYADAAGFKLTEAMAMSAAFPGLIGPLEIDPKKYKWFKQKDWGSEEKIEVKLPYKKLHIHDGGVYDNLGLEPFFDIATGQPKKDGCKILVSDAGSRYEEGEGGFSLLRILLITMEQVRALRVRCFMEYLSKDNSAGGYFMMGAQPQSIINKEVSGYTWQSPEDVKFAAGYGTTLNKVKPGDYDKISLHGYELAKACDCRYHQGGV
jgi:NTE family protein